MTILIADDHAIFREGVKNLIITQYPEDEILEAEDGKLTLELLSRHTCHLLILDLNMPQIDGLSVAKEVKQKYPSVYILVLTLYTDYGHLEELLQIGIHSFLTKEASREQMMYVFDQARKGEKYYPQFVSEWMHERLIQHHRWQNDFRLIERFNPKELQVLRLLCQEHTTKEIAKMMHVSHRTVEGYRQNLLQKTETRNSIGLVKFAIKTGLYEP
uniref:Response regulator transcription factor n=1 Tax=Roseihalotalea indica TaxID=2867963 RepID=A0AA49JG59_9BACT|nr:response regulator transcription factor [Tunicatimonas sp. TK19036]